MLIYVMALSYAAVSPIILPFTLLFFLENWLVWRYQILYTFERCYEAGGIVSPPHHQSLCIRIYWMLIKQYLSLSLSDSHTLKLDGVSGEGWILFLLEIFSNCSLVASDVCWIVQL
jgi:hypothetical protein